MKSRFGHQIFWACSLVLAGVAGCSSGPLGPERDALADARAAWTASGPNEYVYRLRRSCFCASEFLREVLVHVRDGEVVSAHTYDDGEPATTPLDQIPTIDDLLDEIEEAIDREAHLVLAVYDDELGYPIDVSIDFIFEAIDDEMAFQVTGFDASVLPTG